MQCMKRSFAIHGTKRLAVRIFEVSCGFQMNCVDSDSVVRIFEDLCGFVMGIFRQMGPESAVFSPKRTVSGRFWTAGNPHDLPKIRTIR